MFALLVIVGLVVLFMMMSGAGQATNAAPEIYVVQGQRQLPGCLLMGVFLLGAFVTIVLFLMSMTPKY